MASTSQDDFLVSMYERMWENISRSVTFSWQPFVVLVAIGTLFAIALNGLMPVWLAASLGVIILGWFFGHIYDANEWFWRNHLIVANLERHFMPDDDKRRINPFLGDIVPPEKTAKLFSTMRPHFFLATALAIALSLFTILFETAPALLTRAWPSVATLTTPLVLMIPYATALCTIAWVRSYREGRRRQYETSYKLAMQGRAVG